MNLVTVFIPQRAASFLGWLVLCLLAGSKLLAAVVAIQTVGDSEKVSSYLSWTDFQNGAVASSLSVTGQEGSLVALAVNAGQISSLRKIGSRSLLCEYSSFQKYAEGLFDARLLGGVHLMAVRGLATDGTQFWTHSYVNGTNHLITYPSKEALLTGRATEDYNLGWPEDLARDISYSEGELHLIFADKLVTYRNLDDYKVNRQASVVDLPSNLVDLVGIANESGNINPLLNLTIKIPTSEAGLTNLVRVEPYLNGVFPSNTPGVGGWQVVNAFPKLNFLEPMQVLSDPSRPGHLLVVSLNGQIWRIPNDPAATPEDKQVVLDISGEVERVDNDHGLYGIELHPQFANSQSPSAGFIYAVYLNPRPDLPGYQNGYTKYWRLARFTMNLVTGIVDPASEVILINQYCPGIWHNGGGMFFGKDGMLYVSVGDNERAAENGQVINRGLRSGVLRIDVDMNPNRSHPILRQPTSAGVPAGWPRSYTTNYFIPNDNPWTTPDGKNLEEFYAIGLRNPYTMSLDSLTGRAWIGDVGEVTSEEINLMDRPGLNFEWPYREGNTLTAAPLPANVIGIKRAPELQYGHSDGSAVIAGFVYRSTAYENELAGKLLFSDNQSGTIWAYDPVARGEKLELANAGSGGGVNLGVVNLCEGPNGEVFIPFQTGRGTPYGLIKKMIPAAITAQPPSRLSEVHAFQDLKKLTPDAAFIPFAPAVQLWSDGAEKSRWIAVPNNGAPPSEFQRISIASENWAFPAGTVIMKHFEMPLDEEHPELRKRLETRFIVCQPGGAKYGVTYRWLDDGSDAVLAMGRSTMNYTVALKSGAAVSRQWSVPSRADCLRCHNSAAGQALGLKEYQLNHDFVYSLTGLKRNQMSTLGYLGLIYPARNSTELAAAIKAHDLDDHTAPLSHRVRSYMDVNCAHCHQPSGGGSGFDARLNSPLVDQSLINESIKGHFSFLPEGKLVSPGSVAASAVHYRAASSIEGIAMPPLSRNVVDSFAVEGIARWIRRLHPEEFVKPSVPTGRYFRLRSLSEVNGAPWTAVAGLKIIGSDGAFYPQSGLTVSDVSSANYSQPGILAIDNDPESMWISQWSPVVVGHPHTITIDLGSAKPIAGFEYQPRIDGLENGRIANWEAYISTDGVSWKLFLAGTFPNTGEAQRKLVGHDLLWPVRPKIGNPATIVAGDFEVVITTDTDVTDFVLTDLDGAVSNGRATALRGGGHYYVATIHPTGGIVTMRLKENVMGRDYSEPSNTINVGYLEEPPQLTAEVISATEAGEQARVRLNLSSPLQNLSSVRVFARSGTAVETRDFLPFDKSLAIPAGVASVEVTLSLVQHAEFVPGRSFYLEFEPGSGYVMPQAELDVPIYAIEQSSSDDVDGDGLPDAWEIAQFGDLSQTAEGDPDGDLVVNLLEYLIGTSPEEPGNYVTANSVRIAAGKATVAWASEVGKTYNLFFSSDLSTWARHAGGSIPATGSHTSATVPLPAGIDAERVFVKIIPKD